jgi:hypothetical protein
VALPESLHIAPELALARVVGELPESDALPGGCLYSPKCDGLRFAIVLAGEQGRRCRPGLRRRTENGQEPFSSHMIPGARTSVHRFSTSVAANRVRKRDLEIQVVQSTTRLRRRLSSSWSDPPIWDFVGRTGLEPVTDGL